MKPIVGETVGGRSVIGAPDFGDRPLKRLSILASFCQLYNHRSLVSIIAIDRPSACLIEGSNGRLSPG